MLKLVKVYLVINPMVLMAERKEVVSHGMLEDGSRVILPAKFLEMFLPDKDKDGAEFVMLSEKHLIKTNNAIKPKHFN